MMDIKIQNNFGDKMSLLFDFFCTCKYNLYTCICGYIYRGQNFVLKFVWTCETVWIGGLRLMFAAHIMR